jgi:hypothetical protein
VWLFASWSVLIGASVTGLSLGLVSVLNGPGPCTLSPWRSLDGTCHMTTFPLAGSVGQPEIWDIRKDLPLLAPYAKTTIDPALPSARLVSNLLFDQPADSIRPNERGVSLFELAYGQFFSHDLSYLAVSKDPANVDYVPVPACDATFDPQCWGNRTLRVPRLDLDNKATGWFDLDLVYGRTEKTARALRTLSGGKLILDEDGYLPTRYARTSLSLHVHGSWRLTACLLSLVCVCLRWRAVS